MAANGALTPPTLPPVPSSPALAKRKHAATKSIIANGASVSAQGQSATSSGYSLQTVLQDILSVLERYAVLSLFALSMVSMPLSVLRAACAQGCRRYLHQRHGIALLF